MEGVYAFYQDALSLAEMTMAFGRPAHDRHNTQDRQWSRQPAPQWALAYPDREEVHFRLEHDAVDAKIQHLDEQAEGFTFAVKGILTTGPLKDKAFQGIYSVETRSGSLTVSA